MAWPAVSAKCYASRCSTATRAKCSPAYALAPLGIEHVDMPYTAPKLWEIIRRASH